MYRAILFLIIASIVTSASFAPAFAACNRGGFLGCTSLGYVGFCPEGGVGEGYLYYRGEEPYAVADPIGACVFCSTGCAVCVYLSVEVETECGTFIEDFCCEQWGCCTS